MASRGRPDLSWAGSTQLGPDLAGAVREIRDRHKHVKVVGSLNLVQPLLHEKLFDRLDLWVGLVPGTKNPAEAMRTTRYITFSASTVKHSDSRM